MKEFKITLDLVQSTKNPTIYLKNDDLDSVKFLFEVRDDGEVYDLSDVISVRLAVKKPSNVALFQECTVTDGENGLCELVLTNMAYNEKGLNIGELYINDGGALSVTRQFEYHSLGSILAEGLTETNDGAIYWAEVLDKPLTYPPEAHTHDFGSITGKPLTYPPEAHTHAIADVTGLTEELASKLEAIPAEYLTEIEGDGRYAASAHTHTEADVTFGGTNAKAYVDGADNYILNTVLDGLSLWSGTQADYDLIATKDPNTLYFIVG